MSRHHRAGDRLRVRVEHLDDEGLGLAAFPDGRKLRIEDALPGESGEALLLHLGQSGYARLIDRKVASPARATPPCERWTAASPCRLMHLEPAAQAAFKRARVVDAFTRVGLEDLEVRPTVVPPRTLGWRSRVIFVAAETKDGRLVLGAYRRGTHRVQEMERCPLAEPALTAAATALREAMQANEVRAADPGTPVVADAGCGGPLEAEEALAARAHRRKTGRAPPRPDGVRHIALRANASGEVSAVLLTPSGTLPSAEAMVADARARCPSLVSVHLGRCGEGDVVFGGGELVAVGEAAPLLERAGELEVRVSPRSFFQANRGAAAAMSALVLDAAAGPRMVELYAGVGVFGLQLAARGADVTLVESVDAAAADATDSAHRAGLLDRVRVIEDDAAAALQSFEPGSVDTVVVDPPRKGCAPEVLAGIVRLAPPRIVYVSCNPDTLARDVSRLTADGWAVQWVTPVDLFVHSEHIESVALLERPASA